MIKSMRMRCSVHVAYMKEKRNAYVILWKNQKERVIQIGEMSELRWLIGLAKHVLGADSLSFFYLLQ